MLLKRTEHSLHKRNNFLIELKTLAMFHLCCNYKFVKEQHVTHKICNDISREEKMAKVT